MQPQLLFYVNHDERECESFRAMARDLAMQTVVLHSFDALSRFMDHSQIPSNAIIFSNLEMPADNGYHLLKKVRSYKNYDSIPLVVLSNDYEAGCIQKCFDLGASLYIKKELTAGKLEMAVRSILEKSEFMGIDFSCKNRMELSVKFGAN